MTSIDWLLGKGDLCTLLSLVDWYLWQVFKLYPCRMKTATDKWICFILSSLHLWNQEAGCALNFADPWVQWGLIKKEKLNPSLIARRKGPQNHVDFNPDGKWWMGRMCILRIYRVTNNFIDGRGVNRDAECLRLSLAQKCIYPSIFNLHDSQPIIYAHNHSP